MLLSMLRGVTIPSPLRAFPERGVEAPIKGAGHGIPSPLSSVGFVTKSTGLAGVDDASGPAPLAADSLDSASSGGFSTVFGAVFLNRLSIKLTRGDARGVPEPNSGAGNGMLSSWSCKLSAGLEDRFNFGTAGGLDDDDGAE
jgi:hypothetical protein